MVLICTLYALNVMHVGPGMKVEAYNMGTDIIDNSLDPARGGDMSDVDMVSTLSMCVICGEQLVGDRDLTCIVWNVYGTDKPVCWECLGSTDWSNHPALKAGGE